MLLGDLLLTGVSINTTGADPPKRRPTDLRLGTGAALVGYSGVSAPIPPTHRDMRNRHMSEFDLNQSPSLTRRDVLKMSAMGAAIGAAR